MKKLVSILLLFYVAETHAQLGGLVNPGTAAGAVRLIKKKVGKMKTVNRLDYTVDTIRHKGAIAPKQRFKDADLMSVMGDNANENRVALAIRKLQEQLENMRQYLSMNREINFIKFGDQYLEEIKSERTGFDCTLFEKELELYKRFRYVKTTEELNEEREQEQRNLDRLLAEDENTVTEFDRELASQYTGSYNSKRSASQAYDKIERLKKREKQRVTDSIAAVERLKREEEQKQAAKAEAEQEKKDKIAAQERAKKRKAELTAKYGAEDANLIMAGKVRIGMNKDMCRAAWGKPYDINTTTTARHVHEQWVYNLKSYLYFDDGLLTSIQN